MAKTSLLHITSATVRNYRTVAAITYRLRQLSGNSGQLNLSVIRRGHFQLATIGSQLAAFLFDVTHGHALYSSVIHDKYPHSIAEGLSECILQFSNTPLHCG